MLYILISRTRSDLSPEEYQRLGQMAQAFYDGIPPGLTLHGDWAANDRSCTFSLLETEDPRLLETIQAPFRDYVNMELIAVTPATGWNRR
jgi:hypothetical protein